MKRAAALLAFALLARPAHAGRKPAPAPALSVDHAHPSGAFVFRTPAGWAAGPVAGKPAVYEASGDGVIVRFVYRPQESGYDSMHVDCMLERLAGPMETEPGVTYEYDFLSGESGDRRFLDSAFLVKYDAEIRGSRAWRQRNLTIVGAGESLCVITYVPLAMWKKKDSGARELLDAVVNSVTLRKK